MFERHRPQHWVYGHWHVTVRMERDGCAFTCLGELEGAEVGKTVKGASDVLRTQPEIPVDVVRLA